jgi:hypothetical protein
MKRKIKKLLIAALGIFMVGGCNLLDVESDRLVFPDGYKLDGANDSTYSMFAVFSQLQKLADSYILLGELRADLLDLADDADINLRKISELNIESNNPYLCKEKDYYAVINNCNYIINTVDTAVVIGSIQVNKRVFAAAKAIRAWTYMQLALNYGKATYYEKPILTVADAERKDYPVYNIQQLAPVLIADLLPVKGIIPPALGTLGIYNSRKSFFPVSFLLGDLYLWSGQYQEAATEYRNLMIEEKYLITAANRSTLEVVNNTFTGRYSNNPNWGNIFVPNSNECISRVAMSNQYGHFTNLDSLNVQKQFKPSEIALKNWNEQRYVQTPTLDTLVDLRKFYSVASVEKYRYTESGYLFNYGDAAGAPNSIYKWIIMNPLNYNIKQVLPYRVALLYLRYAEAINRLGKPNAALAVLKNGLNRTNMASRRIFPAKELIQQISQTVIKSKLNPQADSVKYDTTYVFPTYMDFSDPLFDANIGIRMRSLGNANMDTTYFKLPRFSTTDSLVTYMEDLIVKELALETAFEGNRFHDLMRIAIRRNNYAYLADKVASKHKNNSAAIRQKLMDSNNWFIKE